MFCGNISFLLAIVVLYFYIGNDIAFKHSVSDSINTSYVQTDLVLAAAVVKDLLQ